MATEILALFPYDVPAKQKKGLTNTEAAYLAGLLDGEGYFSIHRKSIVIRKRRYGSYEHFVSLTMTSKDFMERIVDMVPWGKGKVRSNPRNLKGRARPSWRIKWSMNACEHLCKAILPYIRLKKRHVELILMVIAAKKKAQDERKGQGHAYPVWIRQLQESAVVEFRSLNQRGQDNACEITRPATLLRHGIGEET